MDNNHVSILVSPDLLNSHYLRAQLSQSFVNVLVTPVYLFDILDHAFAFGAQRCNEQCNAGAYVGAANGYAAKLLLSFQTDNHRTMRIAEDDLRAHVDQLVNKKQTALKH